MSKVSPSSQLSYNYKNNFDDRSYNHVKHRDLLLLPTQPCADFCPVEGHYFFSWLVDSNTLVSLIKWLPSSVQINQKSLSRIQLLAGGIQWVEIIIQTFKEIIIIVSRAKIIVLPKKSFSEGILLNTVKNKSKTRRWFLPST